MTSNGPNPINESLPDLTERFFAIQSRVLADPEISAGAKLIFCNLLCRPGFRGGWKLSDSRWSLEDRRFLYELDRAGYVQLFDEPEPTVHLATLFLTGR